MLVRLARGCVHHRWIVIGAWVAVLFIVSGIAQGVGADWRTEFVLPSGEAREVQDTLEEVLPTELPSRVRSSSRRSRASTTRRSKNVSSS